jgi:CRP-like cAMP-binding protein
MGAVIDVREALGLQDAVAAFGLRCIDLRPRRLPVDEQLELLDAPLIIVEGAILRTVELMQRTGAELLGSGDPLQVRDDPDIVARHRVLTPTRLAVLEASRLAHFAREPDILSGLLNSVDRRTTTIAGQIVCYQFNSLDERLSVLLTELAERWGVVTPDGIVLPGFLSHSVLAALTGTRRPSLTAAMVRLTAAGHLRRLHDRRWLVSRDFLSL